MRGGRTKGALALVLILGLVTLWWGGGPSDAAPTPARSQAAPERTWVVRAPTVAPTAPEAEDTGMPPALEPDEALALALELAEEEALPLARIRGQVRTADGEVAWRGMPVVTGCELQDVAFLGPGYWELVVLAGACEVQGRAPDGLLYARSAWEEVDLRAGEVVELDLYLPDERTGGLGVQIAAHEHGVLVDRVLPGTPADDLGLAPGDLIVEVDGLPTTALELDEFIEVMTGPAGTEVEFVLELELDTGFAEEVITLTREVLTES